MKPDTRGLPRCLAIWRHAELAGARAAVLVRYLQEKGVAPPQLAAVSRGQYDPVSSNDTAAGRAQDRRTELLIIRPR